MSKLSSNKDKALLELDYRGTPVKPLAVEYDDQLVVTVPAYAVDSEKHSYAADLSVISFRFKAYPDVFQYFSAKMQDVCYSEFAQNSRFIEEVFELSYKRFYSSKAYFVDYMAMTTQQKRYLSAYDDTVRQLSEKQFAVWKRDFVSRSTRDEAAYASQPAAGSAAYTMADDIRQTPERRVIANPTQKYQLMPRQISGRPLAPFGAKARKQPETVSTLPEEQIETRTPVQVAEEYANVKARYLMPRAAIQAPAQETYSFSPKINSSSARLAKGKRKRDVELQQQYFQRYTERFSQEAQKPEPNSRTSAYTTGKAIKSPQRAEDDKVRAKAEALIKYLESKYNADL